MFGFGEGFEFFVVKSLDSVGISVCEHDIKRLNPISGMSIPVGVRACGIVTNRTANRADVFGRRERRNIAVVAF